MGISLPEEHLEPLLRALETTIHRYCRTNPRLRDAEEIDMLHEIQRAHRRSAPTEVGAGLAQALAWTLVE